MPGSDKVDGSARAPGRGHTHDACAGFQRRRPEAYTSFDLFVELLLDGACAVQERYLTVPHSVHIRECGKVWLIMWLDPWQEEFKKQCARVVANVRMMWW